MLLQELGTILKAGGESSQRAGLLLGFCRLGQLERMQTMLCLFGLSSFVLLGDKSRRWLNLFGYI